MTNDNFRGPDAPIGATALPSDTSDVPPEISHETMGTAYFGPFHPFTTACTAGTEWGTSIPSISGMFGFSLTGIRISFTGPKKPLRICGRRQALRQERNGLACSLHAARVSKPKGNLVDVSNWRIEAPGAGLYFFSGTTASFRFEAVMVAWRLRELQLLLPL